MLTTTVQRVPGLAWSTSVNTNANITDIVVLVGSCPAESHRISVDLNPTLRGGRIHHQGTISDPSRFDSLATPRRPHHRLHQGPATPRQWTYTSHRRGAVPAAPRTPYSVLGGPPHPHLRRYGT